ncbi:MAG TPA: hypothetical protein VEA44_00730 [Caulobacter sp.]|nr:hypothetical protein [Caulobacter sp.]
MNATAKLSKADKVRIGLAGIGLVMGGIAGAAVARLEKAGVLGLEDVAWSDMLAGLIAVCFLVMAVVMTLASFNARAAARMVDPGGSGPATPAQASLLRQQALVMGLAGGMMAAPAAASVLFGVVPPVLGSIVMLAIVAAFLVQTAYNLLIWRRADELMRKAISETGAACFWILQGLLFLWAAAEKLSLAPALSAWDMMVLLMSVYLVTSSLVAMRRGLA